MKSLVVFFLMGFSPKFVKAQVPRNDDCAGAIKLGTVRGFCSAEAAYSNVRATPSGFDKALEWPAIGNDVWFSFVATAYDVNINVKAGGTAAGTLLNPLIAIYSGDCTTILQEIGQSYPGNTQSAYYKGALTVGVTYFIRVSATNNATGTFQLCVDNFFPAIQPGQDCATASLLCSKDRVSPINVTGAGLNNREAAGTCIDINSNGGSIEANTAWYKWIAANNGTLTFTITPTNNNDDIDWVLYDLGPSGNCSAVTAANAIRCAAGSGVTCSPKYYLTGLDANSTDTQETGGCVPGQDGFVRFIDMQQGRTYALLINNFSSGNNGFTLEFGGTGEFLGPKPTFKTTNTFCDNVFTTTYQADDVQAGYTYNWDFGLGGNIRKSTSPGPVSVNYNNPGERTVTLEVTSPIGCTTYQSYFFKDLGVLNQPQILNQPPTYCVGDTLVLEPANQPEGTDVVWTLPDGTEIRETILKVPITSIDQTGTISLKYVVDDCGSPSTVIDINVLAKPVAAFTLDPSIDQLFSAPISFNFINNSVDAVSYQWDFGDGATSTQTNPSHTFDQPGSYVVTLIANNGICADTLSTNVIKILAEGDIIVPNTFTPNNDGVNDYFNILIANLKTYNIKIFNRYGSLVFTSTKILDSWDGNYQGKPMPVGVYYFIIDGLDVAGNKLFRKNSVTLIR
ncbi:PKD domain-containing protein [Pedobacter cryophilus]|nr:PKD domain-containing protein [Pedobacter cryophilus]